MNKKREQHKRFVAVLFAITLLWWSGLLIAPATAHAGVFNAIFSSLNSASATVVESVGGFFGGLFKTTYNRDDIINDNTIKIAELSESIENIIEEISLRERTIPTTTKPTIIERIIERQIVEQPVIIKTTGITQDEMQAQLSQMENSLRSEIAKVSDTNSTNTASAFRAISYTNKIDKLGNITISNSTISGTLSGLTDAHIPDSITVSNYLLLSGGTITGSLIVTASTTFNGIEYLFPSSDGSSAQVLSTNSTGGLSWISISSSSGKFSTTTDSLAIHPVDVSDVLIIGGSATTTTGNIFEVIGNSLFGNNLTAYNTITAPLFVATSTTATSTIAGGFNIDSGAFTYDFSSTNIGVGTLSPARKFSVFNTSANPQFRVSYDGTNYAEFTISATGDMTIAATGGDISLLDENFKVCAGDGCPTASYSGNGNLLVEGTVEAGNYTQTCPTGYIWVPGATKFGTLPGFCVMKYEASSGGGSTATSDAANNPWVSISQETSRAECLELGTGYHLINDKEWMTIAENIANTTINDMDDDAGLQLATGHSDTKDFGNVANAIASVAGADPVVSGCTLTSTMENSANAYDDGVCEIRGNGGDGSLDADEKGYYDTGDVWSATGYVSGGENKSQLRTHVLSNGNVIWDIAGNVWEWTDALAIQNDVPKDASPAAEWLEYTALTAYNSYAYVRPPDDGWSSTNGIGKLYSQGSGTASRAF